MKNSFHVKSLIVCECEFCLRVHLFPFEFFGKVNGIHFNKVPVCFLIQLCVWFQIQTRVKVEWFPFVFPIRELRSLFQNEDFPNYSSIWTKWSREELITISNPLQTGTDFLQSSPSYNILNADSNNNICSVFRIRVDE